MQLRMQRSHHLLLLLLLVLHADSSVCVDPLASQPLCFTVSQHNVGAVDEHNQRRLSSIASQGFPVSPLCLVIVQHGGPPPLLNGRLPAAGSAVQLPRLRLDAQRPLSQPAQPGLVALLAGEQLSLQGCNLRAWKASSIISMCLAVSLAPLPRALIWNDYEWVAAHVFFGASSSM